MTLEDKIRALIADYRARQYNYPGDRISDVLRAQNDGKEDAYREAADDLEALLKETAK